MAKYDIFNWNACRFNLTVDLHVKWPFNLDIQTMGEMEPEFDNETLNLTGKTLRFIMKKTANFGVNNYIRFKISFFKWHISSYISRLQADCDEKWSYHNSFFFAGTLGLGHIISGDS